MRRPRPEAYVPWCHAQNVETGVAILFGGTSLSGTIAHLEESGVMFYVVRDRIYAHPPWVLLDEADAPMPPGACVQDAVSSDSSPVGPPSRAEMLLLFVMPAGRCESLLGDLEEEFTGFIVPRIGLRRGRLWYWRQALGSAMGYIATGAIFGLVAKLIRRGGA